MDTKIKILDQLSLSKVLDQEAELIPLMTEEDEERLNAEAMPDELAILPLRNTVLFPGVVIPITVGRDKSIKLIKEANDGDKIIGVVAQKDALVEDPKIEDLNIEGLNSNIILNDKFKFLADVYTLRLRDKSKYFHLNYKKAVLLLLI